MNKLTISIVVIMSLVLFAMVGCKQNQVKFDAEGTPVKVLTPTDNVIEEWRDSQ